MIPYGKQNISDEDIDAVVEVLKSDYLTQGAKVPAFEQAIANHCHVQYAIATNSATSALHIACLALGVGEGDIVWTSPISFVASANCALYCGAKIDFVDIDISTGNLSIKALEKKLLAAKASNTLPKVIIPVHMAGQPCNMKAINMLAEDYGFNVIEDASHAIGAQYQNAPVGNCQYSDITIFSFHPVKIITSAEGGVATTNNTKVAEKLRRLRSHGITANKEQMKSESDGPWYYQQIELGFNYRMTDLHAALGLSQTKRLNAFVTKRNQLAKRYDEAFKSTHLTTLTPKQDCYSSYHLYLVLLPFVDKEKHKQIITTLREMNICAHVHYIPIHSQPYYQDLGFSWGDFPMAEEYYQRVISLPLYPDLCEKDQEYIIDSVIGLL